MKGFIKKNSKREKGFTLVELLIVFTLLGVLAAIMIPNVSGLIGFGHTQSADTELSIVQTAMDAMMAKNSIASVTATTNTQNMSGFPSAGGEPLYPNYLRQEITTGNYSCNGTGFVTRDSTGYPN